MRRGWLEIRRGILGAALVACVGVVSCERDAGDAAATGPSSTVEGEGIVATATLRSGEATMADLVIVDLEVRTEREDVSGVDVILEESAEWSRVRREERGVGRAGDAGRVVGSTIVLEPYLPGELKTPEIVVRALFSDGGEGEGLTIEPFVVDVLSVIEGDPEAAEMADVKSVVDAPRMSRLVYVLAGVGGAVLLIGAAVIGVLLLRGKGEAVVPARPAHELAYEALERLRERGLVESGLMGTFYFELSGILRRYIERRFGLHAPERTTEEFLQEARGCVAMGTRDVELLERFLEHCDLVKFAKLPVGRDQAELSVTTVRDFVDRTHRVGAEPGGGGVTPAVDERGAAA